MVKDDFIKFVERCMLPLSTIYNRELSKELQLLYFEALLIYSLNDARNAVKEHIADEEGGKFFPRPADLIKRINTKVKFSLEDKTKKVMRLFLDKQFTNSDILANHKRLCNVAWARNEAPPEPPVLSREFGEIEDPEVKEIANQLGGYSGMLKKDLRNLERDIKHAIAQREKYPSLSYRETKQLAYLD